MGTPEIVLGICEFVVLLFALSLHESAHGWMASRLGDQTARMLGRITLNPIKHIDPVGTIMLPLVAMVTHIPLIGWAKPTPVNTRNFKNLVRDDILDHARWSSQQCDWVRGLVAGADHHRQDVAGRIGLGAVGGHARHQWRSIRSSWR